MSLLLAESRIDSLRPGEGEQSVLVGLENQRGAGQQERRFPVGTAPVEGDSIERA
jgi:hypothetical protein